MFRLNPFMFAVLPLPSYICMRLRIPNRAAPKLVGNCKTPGDQSQTKRSGFDVPRMCLLPSEKKQNCRQRGPVSSKCEQSSMRDHRGCKWGYITPKRTNERTGAY